MSSQNALCEACRKGDMNAFMTWFDANDGIDMDWLLRIACQHGKLNFVILLHEKGADIRHFNDYCIKEACKNGHLDIVIWLHEHGADIRCSDDILIQQACYDGHLEIASWLIEQGLDMEKNAEACIMNTCSFEVMKWLCEKFPSCRRELFKQKSTLFRTEKAFCELIIKLSRAEN